MSIVQVLRLGIILAFDDNDLTPEVIEDIIGMEEGVLKLWLRGLSSLIAFVEDKKGEYLTGEVLYVGGPYFYMPHLRIIWSTKSLGPFPCRQSKI